ncbi:1-phosphatidylinositol 4,5-bisphosphate phosphodiesterase eta-1 isoform X2 [Electrophorus electricus]|uniref:1-phosphatidylinositol 4,5-bisphosphate phosphodiesterase eta-1 isoform X2 n=1 Tax=Electrophorus electricus TaxID=8005 RepID=UPI0015D095AB|nr:1-phosphatidylinositol 4,5-bisphosphate phosphodiesterase eta-1 isoform X2 [Electrophorus electricus]
MGSSIMAELEVLKNLSFERVERCMSVMQSGTQMVKLKNGSKGLVRLFYLDEHCSCIRWRPSRKSEKAKITIDSLYKVTEGRQSDIFHRHADGNFDPGCCFTIYHGNHMESLDLVTSSIEEARTWVTGLRYLMAGISDEDSLAKRQRTHDQWMKQTFEEADKNGDGLLNIDEIYQLLHKMNVNLPRRKVKQMFQEADTDEQQGTLTFEEFSVFYRMMSLRRDLFLLLMCFSEKKDHLTAEELGNFLRVEQKMSSVTPEYCLDIIGKFELSEENKEKGFLGIEGFTNFMRSPACDVFNPLHNEVNQDMDQPLCNYFIASSHNTYLTGDQLLSHSKTDMYAWVLQAGCRCVEVDCWDGPDGEPMVQHGYTLTSKINFKSVIETINKYAFVNNEYPVILSIENHCNIQQQKKIAQHLKEIFKEKLDVGMVLNRDSKHLPSPNSLKGKILIKGKRLPPYLSADAEEGEVSDDDSADEIEDDFKLKNSTSNGPTQHLVESHIRKKLDSLLKESQISDREDADSFSIRALLRATHEGLHKNLRKNSKEGLKKSHSRSFISNLKQKRHSKSRLKCHSVDTDDDGQQESAGQFNRCGRRRKTMKLSRDLSDLVVFTNSVVSQECLDEGSIVNVLSFSEARAQHLAHHRAERFLNFNQRQLSRIYPSAYRIDSSNFNPQTYWNTGCQLVALNYQTEGRMMQLNRAKFMVNGGVGYVLKPPPMCKGSFNPCSDDPLPACPKKQLVLKIISGQQLPKPPDSMLGDRGEIIDPFVEVEIIGLPVDCCKEQTRVVDDNGFNPVWEETLSFTVHMPEITLVRFLVWDHDPIGRDFIGQRTVAFSSLMPGYRHVYLEGMTEASIFVHISVHDIYGKWSPLVLNPSYTILHFLGTNKGRQLRGFRGLFSKSSKCSVDTNVSAPPRKRSMSSHLLRRTASAPAKGRKKTKKALSDTSLDGKDSNGDLKPQAVGRRMGPRMTLQHRPASMPLEKILQSQLTLSSPEHDGPDFGADTIIDSFCLETLRTVSVDLLIEKSAHQGSDDIAQSTDHIQDRTNEVGKIGETSYLVIGGGGETNTDDIHTEPLEYGFTQQTKADDFPFQSPPESHLSLSDQPDLGISLQTESCQRETPQNNKMSKACSLSSSSSSRIHALCPLSPIVLQTNQQSQMSLQDSVLSRLIDAVSLGNEHDTCRSISALISQFDVTAEQSDLNLSSGSRPSKLSVLPTSNQISSTRLKVIQESLQKAAQPVERPVSSSPETTEPAAFTILDEKVLSPDSWCDLPVQPICNVNIAPGDSRGSSSKLPFGSKVTGNGGWGPYRDKSCRDQFQSNGSSRNWECGGYRETSINSTTSDRFLMCHDSASSSLMEVEINVDEDPLDATMTMEPLQHDTQWNSDPELLNSSSFHRPVHKPLSPCQNPFYVTAPTSKSSYKPTANACSTESSTFHKPCQHLSPHQPLFSSALHQHGFPVSKPTSEQFNSTNATLKQKFQPGRNNNETSNDRQLETRDRNDLTCRTQCFRNGYVSRECLLRTQGMKLQQDKGSYMPESNYDMIYSSMEYGDRFCPPKQFSQSLQQNQSLNPTPSKIYNGIYVDESPNPKAPSPCKSKSLGDLTSEDISCNFQSKYKVISRSFITPAMQNQRRIGGLTNQPQLKDSLTEQLRKLVALEEVDRPWPFPSQFQPAPKPLSVNPPDPVSSVVSTEDPEDPPPFLSRKLSSRSQSRVRHIASRARERQQDALKLRPAGGAPDVMFRNKSASSQNILINRHSTGSYIAGYFEQDRGLPEGSCTTMHYSYRDPCYTDDSVLPSDSCPPSEPEVYFLLRL